MSLQVKLRIEGEIFEVFDLGFALNMDNVTKYTLLTTQSMPTYAMRKEIVYQVLVRDDADVPYVKQIKIWGMTETKEDHLPLLHVHSWKPLNALETMVK